MSPVILTGADQVRAAVGETFGPTEWLEITQDRIDSFAEATGDHQWIHVDVERAATESPFGSTIAHGYLTLALTNLFLPQLVIFDGFASGVNYGADKVRFPAAVPVGSRVRATAQLAAAEEVRGGLQTTMVVTVELEGSQRPACVVEAISRFLN